MKVDELWSDEFEGISLLNLIESVEDPRIERSKLYPLEEVLLVALCAMLCNCEGFRAFAIWGEEKIDLLRKIYAFSNGVPSHDTFARVFTLLCPKQFSLLLTRWTEGLRDHLADINHVAFDGKTLRGSRKKGDKHSAIHVVSAFASDCRLTLAQCKAPHKGYGENEAMLEIIDYLRIQGATVTADAASCRRPIAQAIVDKKADYVLALKGNQGDTHEAVEAHFDSKRLREKAHYYEHHDKGHGRIECRKCWATEDLRALSELEAWPHLKSIVCIESERIIGEKQTCERRYYLSSLTANPEQLLKIIRAHWSVENSLHWVLDVTFSEDGCRARTKNAPENMAILRRMVTNVLRKIKKPNETLKGCRIRASANDTKLLHYVSSI